MLFSDGVKHMLLKNIHVFSLNVLNYVYIVVFDVKTELETVGHISDSKATRIANFRHPVLSMVGGGGILNFSHENLQLENTGRAFRKYTLKQYSSNIKLKWLSLHKIRENTGFHWPVFSCIRTESRFCSYKWEYGSVKTRILAYFMQWLS